MSYDLRDQLDSVVTIANESGASDVEQFGYEDFGERRYPDGTPQDRVLTILTNVLKLGTISQWMPPSISCWGESVPPS